MAVSVVRAWNELDMDAVCARAKVIAFDLDNTLARSKKPMSGDMAHRVSRLTSLIPLAIVTGGSFGLVRSQVLDVLDDGAQRSNMHIMPTSGTRCYRWDGGQWKCVYEHDLSERDRSEATRCLRRRAQELGMWVDKAWGPRIEDRGSQITFSALGQLAPVELKEAWDPTNEKKNRLAQAVAADLPHLAVRSGGSTSIDISERGVDKAYAVRRLADILRIDIGQIVFVGDRMDPDGNDYPAAVAGTVPVRVSGPCDTLKVCDRFIARLSE